MLERQIRRNIYAPLHRSGVPQTTAFGRCTCSKGPNRCEGHLARPLRLRSVDRRSTADEAVWALCRPQRRILVKRQRSGALAGRKNCAPISPRLIDK
eukprot:4161508-Pyramimonas_sp.AAC.1